MENRSDNYTKVKNDCPTLFLPLCDPAPLRPFSDSFYSAMGMQRPGPAPPVVPGPQNSAQAPPANIQLAQSVPQPPVQRTKQRRTHAVPIIDPVTGKSVCTYTEYPVMNGPYLKND